ncbi:MAG TPA: N-acetyltransferase [Aggregatilineales bacterium]|nr:N-acetyltransferase [Aggregatilineales bacterium]
MNAHLASIMQFTQAHSDRCTHVVDLPYRLCSPAAQHPDNARIWYDSQGHIIGFGLLQWQFSVLDWATAEPNESLKRDIFDWALTRLHEERHQRGAEFGFLIGSSDADDAEAHSVGFKRGNWSMCHLSMPFHTSVPSPALPPDLSIRPLHGTAEVEAYVAVHRAAFDSRNMSVDWRARTLKHPAYLPEIDFVAQDSQGKLIAFCIGWTGSVNGVKSGQIEPIGVLPEAQRQGIGRAMLLTALNQMRAMGCEVIYIDAESDNEASTQLYTSVGFREFSRSYQYSHWFE